MRATWNTITKTLPNCTGIICASKRALGTTTLESFISGPNNKSIHTAYFTLAKHTKTQTRAHKHTAQAHLPHKAHANPTKLPFEILTGFSPLKQFAQIIIKKNRYQCSLATRMTTKTLHAERSPRERNNAHIARLPHTNHNARYVATPHKHMKLIAVAIRSRVRAT